MKAPRNPIKSQDFKKAFSQYKYVLQLDKEYFENHIYFLFQHLEEVGITSFEDIDETHIQHFLRNLQQGFYNKDKRGIELATECIDKFLVYLSTTYGIFLEPEYYTFTKDGVRIKMGKHIKKLREEKGWSQSKLARKLNESEEMVVQLENGGVPLNFDSLRFVSCKLGVSLQEVLDF